MRHDQNEETTGVRRMLRQAGAHARKGLGQHFLINRAVLNDIVAAAELTPDDIVIEIGPGLGILTEALAARAGRVIAIELDEKLVYRLRRTLAGFANVSIIQGDALEIQPWRQINASTYKVVANLPYYVATPVIRKFLHAPKKPSILVVMVQKEVAESMAAPPGKMSLLSVIVQYYAQSKIAIEVPPDSFYPPPKVSSAVIKLVPHTAPPVEVEDAEAFFNFVAAGFRQPRKQISNSLAKGLEVAVSESAALLDRAGIDRHRRAETLDLKEWATLWKASRL
ncbi:MAG: ribosomal RNA small subunit methyltransferase A [Chloroflexi bacterium]|nr:ribosomal RNA small subunit methyltransferase A [Chloroflexota bacterium]